MTCDQVNVDLPDQMELMRADVQRKVRVMNEVTDVGAYVQQLLGGLCVCG